MQDDIKKVLAYSTVSQLGYMVMALGVRGWTAAIFHLFTHAFFKACLFLGAGSVSHSGSHHSFDMKKDMGGLRKHMPITYVTFVIASLALAGIFPLAGFWSKDEILLDGRPQRLPGVHGRRPRRGVLTAAYMARCVYLTFHGEYRGPRPPARVARRPSPSPLVILAGAVGRGRLAQRASGSRTSPTGPRNQVVRSAWPTSEDYPFSLPAAPRQSSVGPRPWSPPAFAGYFGVLRGVQGFGGLDRAQPSWPRPATPATASSKQVLPRPPLRGRHRRRHQGARSPRAAYWFNQNVIDGIVNGVGVGTPLVAEFVYDGIDQTVVDGAVNGVGAGAEEGGQSPRAPCRPAGSSNTPRILFAAAGLSASASC